VLLHPSPSLAKPAELLHGLAHIHASYRGIHVLIRVRIHAARFAVFLADFCAIRFFERRSSRKITAQ
jgi:hypothetical protein